MSVSQTFGATVSLKARPPRSMRGAVQTRAWLMRGTVQLAALRAPSRAAIPAVFTLGTAALTRTTGQASCCVSAASASAARLLLRTDM
jgi:hypothetical protein